MRRSALGSGASPAPAGGRLTVLAFALTVAAIGVGVRDGASGWRFWAPIAGGALLVVAVRAWRAGETRPAWRGIAAAALDAVTVVIAFALVTPWRGPNAIPGAGHVAGMLGVLALGALGRGRLARRA